MKNELIINGKDAFLEWGVRMGDNFLDAIGGEAPMKEFIENKSRLEHGKRVITTNPKLDERELTLAFTIEGSTRSDYQAKKKAFYEELRKVEITIQVPKNSDEVYHLLYTGKSFSYTQSLDRKFGRINCKFCEYNPSNRVAEK